MQKVLIISYFFPPCNLTASQRPFAWARYLPEYGYEATVITRNWDVPILSSLDMSKDAGDSDRLEDHKTFKVWYMKHRGNLRDRFFVRFGYERHVFIRRALSLMELIFQSFYVGHLSYENIYLQARKVLSEDNSIRKVLITANPFTQFHFGYLLKKEFPHVQWIADYRDDWTSTELHTDRTLIEVILHQFHQWNEVKWLSNAACFTTVSQKAVERISRLVKKPGTVNLNGYDDTVLEYTSTNGIAKDRSKFIITYNGSLYKTQPVEILLDAFKQLTDKFKEQIQLILQFPGLAFDKQQEERVRSYLKGYVEHVLITARIPRLEVMELQRKSNILVLIGHKGIQGIAPSKMFEYVALKKHIMLVCNDHDSIEDVLRKTRLGIICDTTEEIVEELSAEIDSFILNGNQPVDADEQKIESYSRKNQVKKLADLLDGI